MNVGLISAHRTDTSATRFRQELRAKALAAPSPELETQLSAQELERASASRAKFAKLSLVGAEEARIVGLWSADDRGGLPRTRWRGPGEPATFYMSVRTKSGKAEGVVPELWTNINHGLHPEDFEGIPMEFAWQQDDVVTYKATIPLDRVGNFRVSGRISTSTDPANPKWQWAGDAGVPDIRYRPRPVASEAIAEHIVHVGLANSDHYQANVSTLRDLIDPSYGKYNLWAIKAAGKSHIRLQPPFRADRWDRAHPYDTLGSPYAATDFFSIDPRYSRDVQTAKIPDWDKDRQREVANAEFWEVVDKAHELGLGVILDIALNHSGHNTTFRDLFDDPKVGERVLRNNFDQVTVNDEQREAVQKRIEANPYGTGEELFPELFASKYWDPAGAHGVIDMTAGGNGEWADTKQYNHGAYNWGCVEHNTPINQSVTDWYTRILRYWVDPPKGEPGAPKRGGVDGFRLDHSSNLPTRFYERSMTQLQALVDKPISFVLEDFNQGEKLRVYGDVMESGWYRDVTRHFKNSDIGAIQGIVNSHYFFETLRGGNHDEERVIELFEGDIMAAGRYLCMIELMGGWSTTVMGDEFGEQHKVEFKHRGGVPAVLAQARYNQLGRGSIELQAATGRAGRAKADDPSLKTALRAPIWARGPEGSIMGLARHADDKTVTGTLVFANLANRDTMQNTFNLDDETKRRIDPAATYRARDLMASDANANVWGRDVKGAELINDGVFVRLTPYQIQALKIERV